MPRRGSLGVRHQAAAHCIGEATGRWRPVECVRFGYLCMEGICAAPLGDVDVWLRDDPTDTGLEPFAGDVTWLSPDIELLDPAGVAVANPTHDAANLWNNLVDVTVRNRGTQAANNVDVYLYWADPATNLPFPGEWRVTGIYTGASPVDQSNLSVIPQLAAGAQTTVRFAWAPPPPGANIRGDDHFSCSRESSTKAIPRISTPADGP